MGFTHLQKAVRDRTIDAQPNDPSTITDPVIALNYLIEGLETRLARLEELVTQLSREALRNAVTEAVTPDRNAVTDAVTLRNAYCNAERQRSYRERKKRPGT